MTGFYFRAKPLGDDVAGDDEENVDPDEASREIGNPCVKEKNRKNCDSSQAIDVSAVLHKIPGRNTQVSCVDKSCHFRGMVSEQLQMMPLFPYARKPK